MFVKFYILVALMASSDCAFQNSRYKNGYRQNNAASATGGRGRVRTCTPPKVVNGFVTPLFKGKMMRYDCNKGYSRLGERYSECISGRWSIYTFPICIKAGCPIITTPDNGKITYLNAKASAMLFCEPNYETVGSNYAHCNGSHWDRTIGSCRETVNAPATSCDFESENICGWTHDTDHDFDFERRNGYNNKTISMVTGPHADHTSGIPFQGHYMVINTNTEVSPKHARLISPLYKINATSLCFKFYYHMYGVNIGTLRVYLKPESIELEDILREDTESQVNNDYVVFEIKGSQGNNWQEGGDYLKALNESFQIIIEAVSGQTRLSDIAFDDVSLLTDEDCDENDEDTKAQDMKDDDDGVFAVESCVNRCFEDRNATVQLSANHTLSCSCSLDCDPKASCCPDFIDVCMKVETNSTSTEAVIVATTSTLAVTVPTNSTQATISTQAPTLKAKASTVKLPTHTPSTTTVQVKLSAPVKTSSVIVTSTTLTSTTPQVISSTMKAIPRMPQRAPIFNQTDEKESIATEPVKDYDEVEGKHEASDEPDYLPTVAYESDNFVNERYMMRETKRDENSDVSFIIKASVIAISTLFLSFIVFVVAFRQYKKSTNPLNYKEKNEHGSRKANEEFSEIRYLTSDETLDFNLVTPDSITDL